MGGVASMPPGRSQSGLQVGFNRRTALVDVGGDALAGLGGVAFGEVSVPGFGAAVVGLMGWCFAGRRVGGGEQEHPRYEFVSVNSTYE